MEYKFMVYWGASYLATRFINYCKTANQGQKAGNGTLQASL